MSMLSEALYIMDRNMERLMVEEMKEKLEKTIASSQARVEAAKAELEAAKAEVEASREKAKTEAKTEARMEIDAAKAKADAAQTEAETARIETEIFRQRLAGSSPDEIADSLGITLDKVNNVLSSISR